VENKDGAKREYGLDSKVKLWFLFSTFILIIIIVVHEVLSPREQDVEITK